MTSNFKKLLMVGTAMVAVSSFSTQASAADYLAAGNPNALAADPAEVVNFADDAIVTVNDAVNLADAAGVTTATTNTGTLVIAGDSTITGPVGTSTAVLKEITAGVALKTATFSGDVYATDVTVAGTGNIAFNGNVTANIDYVNQAATITVADAKNITGNVDSTVGAAGILTLAGTTTVSGTVGATNGLTTINAGATGKTATFSGAVTATTINVTGDGEVQLDGATAAAVVHAGAGTLDLNADLTGTVDMGAAASTVLLADGVDISGAVTNGIAGSTLDVAGTSTFGAAVTADIAFSADGDATVTGALTGAADNTTGADGAGTLTINAVSAAVTDIGATNSLKGLVLGAAVTADSVNADTVNVEDNVLTVNAATAFASGQQLGFLATADATNGSVATTAGDVTFAAGSSILVSANYAVAAGHTYTITSSFGGAATSAADVLSYVSGFKFTADDATGDVILTAVAKTAAELTNTDRTLGGIDSSADADVVALSNAIAAAPTAEEKDALIEGAQPTVDGSSSVAMMDAAVEVQAVTDTRMASIRNISSGVAAGDAMGTRQFWAQGYYTYADQDVRDGIDGYESDTAGIMLGMDTEDMIDGAVVGVAVNYGVVNSDSENANRTDTEIDSYGITLYGSMDVSSDMFVEGQLGYAHNEIETTRYNCGVSADDVCRGDTDGSQFSAKLALGKDMTAHKNMMITPKIYAAYVGVDNDGYTEVGSGTTPTPLTVQEQEAEALDLGVDVEFAWDVQARDGIMQPSFNIGYAYDAIADDVDATANLVGGTAFKTEGADADENKFIVGAGFTYETNADWDVAAKYDAVMREDYYAHNASLRFTTRF